MLATGHQQRTQLQLGEQLEALGNQLGLIRAATDHRLELSQVGSDQAGTAIDGKILALGIGQHRDVARPRGLDQCLVVLQRTLAVIGEDQHPDLVQQLRHVGEQGIGIGGERLLEVQAQQLLVAAHHPQLDDGRLAGDALEVCVDPCGMQALGQAVGRLVLPGDADQPGRCAEGGDVQRDVGRATRAILDLLDLDHRHRRFRRDAVGRAMPVAVEHDITDHQHGGLIETGHGQLHGISGGV
ncbi:hypothetical protein D3C78_792680 [compost metagenome]